MKHFEQLLLKAKKEKNFELPVNRLRFMDVTQKCFNRVYGFRNGGDKTETTSVKEAPGQKIRPIAMRAHKR